MKYHKPIAPLRTTFIYNNFMYALAGYVAEVLGKSMHFAFKLMFYIKTVYSSQMTHL